METSTKEDKLLFFGISFAALTAFVFIINYVSPISGFTIPLIILLTFFMAGIITFLKHDFTKIAAKLKSTNPNLLSGSIWSILALMKWVKYIQKDTSDWFIALLFSVVAIINWVSFFRKSDK